MKSFFKEWGMFALVLILFILARWLIFSTVTVDGHSMDPTLQNGEILVMLKTSPIDRFDIVVASEPDDNGGTKLIVKRVVGMPGDTIRYENDILYINGEKTDEPYLAEYLAAFKKDKLQSTYSYNLQFQSIAQIAPSFTMDTSGQTSFTVTVPEGQYFLLGDDRLVSKDSRMVGNFDKAAIQGEIVFRFWPFNRIHSF